MGKDATNQEKFEAKSGPSLKQVLGSHSLKKFSGKLTKLPNNNLVGEKLDISCLGILFCASRTNPLKVVISIVWTSIKSETVF